MAQEQRNITVSAPGFGGLNTQDSPVDQPEAFASRADNCVIDKRGRIASRKGMVAYTSNPQILNEEAIESTNEFITRDGGEYVFACGGLQIYKQTLLDPHELELLTLPGGYLVLDNNWQIIPFNNKCYFIQEGHQSLVFDPSTPTELRVWIQYPVGPTDYPNCGLAAFGHLWVSDYALDTSKVYWSDLLDGEEWAAGSSGSIDLTEHWPNGYDSVTALVAHNNFLIIFGKKSILVYNVPEAGPEYTSLTDTVEGIGCIARDSIAATGTDIFFLDTSGVRLFNRTVQEKSMPIGDVSYNVRSDLKGDIEQSNNHHIRAIYSAKNALYVLMMPHINATWVFDTRVQLENGAFRATRWTLLRIQCGGSGPAGEAWFGGQGGLYTYEGAEDVWLDSDQGYLPISEPIKMSYYTNPLNFDSPANLKFPKQVDLTIIGSTNLSLDLKWAYDYSITYNSSNIKREGGVPAQYNISQYNIDEYSGAQTLLSSEKFNIWGNGRNVTLGFEATVTGTPLSIQELNIQALLGRTL